MGEPFVEIQKLVSGRKHPKTPASVSNLAAVRREQNGSNKARLSFAKVINTKGLKHLRTLASISEPPRPHMYLTSTSEATTQWLISERLMPEARPRAARPWSCKQMSTTREFVSRFVGLR